MFSSFFDIFGFLWRSPRERTEAKAVLLGEFASFAAECKSGLIQLHDLRLRDSGVAIGDDVRAYLADMSKQDAVAQKLQWNFRREFQQQEILQGVSELMRRISLTKQVLLFGSSRFRNAAFPHGLMWIDCQAAKVLEQASRLAGVDLDDPGAPFFAGFHPLGMNCEERYEDFAEPWGEIQERVLKEEFEELEAGRDPYS